MEMSEREREGARVAVKMYGARESQKKRIKKCSAQFTWSFFRMQKHILDAQLGDVIRNVFQV